MGKSDYAELLQALCDMRHSFVYAVRRDVLMRAESVIVGLERENRRLLAQEDALREELSNFKAWRAEKEQQAWNDGVRRWERLQDKEEI